MIVHLYTIYLEGHLVLMGRDVAKLFHLYNQIFQLIPTKYFNKVVQCCCPSLKVSLMCAPTSYYFVYELFYKALNSVLFSHVFGYFICMHNWRVSFFILLSLGNIEYFFRRFLVQLRLKRNSTLYVGVLP